MACGAISEYLYTFTLMLALCSWIFWIFGVLSHFFVLTKCVFCNFMIFLELGWPHYPGELG